MIKHNWLVKTSPPKSPSPRERGIFSDNRFRKSFLFDAKFLPFLYMFTLGACKGYDEVNFQTDKCKQPPSATILARQIPNTLRVEFSLDNVVDTPEQVPIYVTWQIDYPAIVGDVRDKSFNAARLSYQFDKPVDQVKIKATLYNRCLMEKSIETTINVK